MSDQKVAALFIDPRGPYPALLGADLCWDESRDARTYAGPWPVVAHPPCQLWTNLAGVNYRRWGGAHNRPGNDGGCFDAALAAVRRWGGVLEHPAGSHAWSTFRLGKPAPLPKGAGWHWAGTGWVCEVWQSAYGHKARKATWLYCCAPKPPAPLNWDTKPGTHQVGWFDRIKPSLGKREASETPVAFAQTLIGIARQAA